MDNTPIIERLAALPALADIPREQLQWLLDHGELHHADDGDTFYGMPGEGILGLFLLISGRFSVRARQGATGREVREVTPGGITGHLPYSRMGTAAPRGYLVADGPTEFLYIRLEDFKEMTRQCYEFTAACVHEMLDRARVFKAEDKRQEKMAALGRLSAGLAHELNNPASAAARAARELDVARKELAAASRDLGAAGLEGASLQALESLQAAVTGSGARKASEAMSPIDRAELEDRIADWLGGRGIDTHLAYLLAEGGFAVSDLDTAAPAFDAGQLAVVLRYLAADVAARGLVADISSAVQRIHSLVAAVKKHTQMDRAPVIEAIRLDEHLTGTVALMSSKASLKRVSLELSVEPDLPTVEASASDLNQVWMQLLDNAIDAVTDAGRVAIDARRDAGCVVVRVIDDGPGIPRETQERVFEPFFTTKDVGEGRGLGLDIVRTVVSSHRGTVDVTSVPGRTEFRVVLPVGAAEARGG